VLEGEGTFLVGSDEESLEAGQAVLAPAGAPHGVTNDGPERLVCLVFMAPHPKPPS
jgi:mannose-6-phosphate isomerase-like protein (cupin superfamily)